MVTARRDLTGDRFECDESHTQGKPALPSGNTEMNAVRKNEFNEFVAVSRGTCNEVAHPVVLKARPVEHPRSFEEMLEHAKKRFSKTLAYLAR